MASRGAGAKMEPGVKGQCSPRGQRLRGERGSQACAEGEDGLWCPQRADMPSFYLNLTWLCHLKDRTKAQVSGSLQQKPPLEGLWGCIYGDATVHFLVARDYGVDKQECA